MQVEERRNVFAEPSRSREPDGGATSGDGAVNWALNVPLDDPAD